MNSALIQQVSMYILIIKGHFEIVNQHLTELQKGDEIEEENIEKFKVKRKTAVPTVKKNTGFEKIQFSKCVDGLYD